MNWEMQHWHTEDFDEVVAMTIAEAEKPKAYVTYNLTALGAPPIRGERYMTERVELETFAARYAQAWYSHNPESVAAFFAENCSLKVNNNAPAIWTSSSRGNRRADSSAIFAT
jgi:hypothetical protein